jgi:DNA repair exonuclease SbcCD nuclease subunit
VISEDPWIVFPGNIQGRHARELGPKGCTLVTVEQGEIVTVEHRDLDVFRWSRCELDVSSSETADGVYEQVRAALQNESDAADGRPVAVRLLLRGTSAAHTALRENHERWVQEYRALATGLAGAGVWLEKVSIKTSALASYEGDLERDDALSSLLRSIRDLELDNESADALADELSALRHKLPAELLGGEEPFDPTSPEVLAESLEEIKGLLVHRLLSSDSKA